MKSALAAMLAALRASLRTPTAEELARRERPSGAVRKLLLHFDGDEHPMASLEAFLDWAGRYREAGIDEVVVHWPVADTAFAGDPEVFEEICREGALAIAHWD